MKQLIVDKLVKLLTKSLAAVCNSEEFAKMVTDSTGHLLNFMPTKITPRFLTSICCWHLQLLCLETALLK